MPRLELRIKTSIHVSLCTVYTSSILLLPVVAEISGGKIIILCVCECISVSVCASASVYMHTCMRMNESGQSLFSSLAVLVLGVVFFVA